MSAPQSIKDTQLWKKTEDLLLKINVLSAAMPQDNMSLYEVQNRLRLCVSTIPESIESGFKQNTRINKIRSIIKAISALEECKDYLCLVERMKLHNTTDLVEDIDTIKEILNGEYTHRFMTN